MMENHRIYFDNAATTRVDDRVTEIMLPLFAQYYGNPSSLHSCGTQAKEILESSRESIAGCIGANRDELFFTSGGTESNNWALKGVAHANRERGRHIIVSAIEHDCVLNTCKWLAEEGYHVTYLPVDEDGLVDVAQVKEAIGPKTILVSVMHANNEIGTIEPVEEIGAVCRDRGVLFHTDACQSFGKIPLDVTTACTDLVTINAHKIYGPKGIGALYIRKGVRIIPLLHGGGQESGMRSTTENLPAIAGFAGAAQLSVTEMDREARRLTALRKTITGHLSSAFDNFYINGHEKHRLPGHLSFSFHGFEGETIRLLLHLDDSGIAVSAGSACSSNDKSHNASHVLKAIGLNPFEARGGIRISMGRFNTENDVTVFPETLEKAFQSLTSIFSDSLIYSGSR